MCAGMCTLQHTLNDALRGIFCDRKEGFSAVIFAENSAGFRPASLAFVNYEIPCDRPFGTHRLHEPTAGVGAFSRIDIHVLAPQTFRAVVRVAIAFREYTAVF